MRRPADRILPPRSQAPSTRSVSASDGSPSLARSSQATRSSDTGPPVARHAMARTPSASRRREVHAAEGGDGARRGEEVAQRRTRDRVGAQRGHDLERRRRPLPRHPLEQAGARGVGRVRLVEEEERGTFRARARSSVSPSARAAAAEGKGCHPRRIASASSQRRMRDLPEPGSPHSHTMRGPCVGSSPFQISARLSSRPAGGPESRRASWVTGVCAE